MIEWIFETGYKKIIKLFKYKGEKIVNMTRQGGYIEGYTGCFFSMSKVILFKKGLSLPKMLKGGSNFFT